MVSGLLPADVRVVTLSIVLDSSVSIWEHLHGSIESGFLAVARDIMPVGDQKILKRQPLGCYEVCQGLHCEHVQFGGALGVSSTGISRNRVVQANPELSLTHVSAGGCSLWRVRERLLRVTALRKLAVGGQKDWSGCSCASARRFAVNGRLEFWPGLRWSATVLPRVGGAGRFGSAAPAASGRRCHGCNGALRALFLTPALPFQAGVAKCQAGLATGDASEPPGLSAVSCSSRPGKVVDLDTGCVAGAGGP